MMYDDDTGCVCIAINTKNLFIRKSKYKCDTAFTICKAKKITTMVMFPLSTSSLLCHNDK